MNKEKIEEYKNQLLKEKGELEQKIHAHEKPTDFGDDVDSYDEEKNEAEQLENDLSEARTYKARVNEIQDALDTIENGGFGICKKCGGDIEEKTLSTDPAQTLCHKCPAEI